MYSIKNMVVGAALSVALLGVFCDKASAQSTITQQVSGVSNALPRDAFYTQINEAVNKITVQDLPAVINQLNAWAAGTNTNQKVAGRTPIVGANATNVFVIDRGTGTNGQVIAFTTAFASAPEVFVTYQSYVATNALAGPSAVDRTNATLNGTAAKTMNWIAIGPK